MDIIKVIRERRSVRRFEKREIDISLVKKIIQLSTWAPSACNRQLWRFVIITDEEIKKKLVDAGSQGWILDSPVSIAVFYHKYINSEHNANLQSAAAAIQNILLIAHNYGVGSLWMAGIGDKERIRKILNAPSNFMPIAFIALGYPDEEPRPPKRREIDKIVGINEFPDFDYPHSIFPEEWSIRIIRDYQEKSCRASLLGYKYRRYSPSVVKITDEEIIPNMKGKILDMYSYDGHLLSVLAQHNKILSYEMSTDIIEFLKAVVARENSNLGNVEFIEGDGYEIPLKENSVDCITLLFKLEMFNDKDRRKVINEVYRVLKPGGQILILYRNEKSIGWLNKIYRIKIKGRKTMDKHYLGMWNMGPYYALNNKNIKSLLRKFNIKKRKGFFFIPYKRSFLDSIKEFCEYQLVIAQK
jgi:nitroreductase/SAM-dependent methyltransferase